MIGMFIKKVNMKHYFSSDKKNWKLNKILSSEWQRFKKIILTGCVEMGTHMWF